MFETQVLRHSQSQVFLMSQHILIRLKSLKDLLVQLEQNIVHMNIDGTDVFMRLVRTEPDSLCVLYAVGKKKGEWVALSEDGKIIWSDKPRPGYLGVINFDKFPLLEELLRRELNERE